MINQLPLVQEVIYLLFDFIDVWYPYSWQHDQDKTIICSAQKDSFDPVKCKELFVTKNTLSITYWSHS
jgi:hypothetical protein